MDAIYIVDYKKSQLVLRQPHRGTCDWLFEHDVFNSWAFAKDSSFLWLIGSPGVGKSVLTRYVAEEVLGGNNRTILPYEYLGASFFCSYQDAARNSEEDILRSLLHQLLHAHPPCQSAVRRHVEGKSTREESYRFDKPDLWKAIEDVLALDAMRYCFICLDALEELPLETLSNLFYGFYAITLRFKLSKKTQQLRVFVSSRPLPYLQKSLSAVHMVRIQSAYVSPHISRYLHDNISEFAQQNSAFADTVSSRMRRKIVDKIVQRADGMFLWASIAWEDFKRGLLWNHDIVRQKLDQLDSTTSGINTLYDRMMGKVDPAIRQDMWSIFAVIAVAGRPLTEPELGTLLAIQRSKQRLTHSRQIRPFDKLNKTIEDNFPDLVKIQDDDSIAFSHLSFREYLYQYWTEKNPEWLDTARMKLAEACIIYLDLQDLVDDLNRNGYQSAIPAKYPLFEYVYNFHIYHLGFIKHDDPLWLRYADLASDKSIYTARWPGKIHWSPLQAVTEYIRSPTLVKHFANHGYDVNEPWRLDGRRNILEYCCIELERSERERLVAALLDAGVDPNRFRYDEQMGETCLQYMIRERVWTLYARVLKHRGTQLGLCNYRGQTVIHYMVQFGHCDDLEHLLHLGGVDINAQDSAGNTALHLAATYSDLAKLKLLLNTGGARVDMQDNNGRTPLTLASYWGLREAALMLISHSTALPVPDRDEMSSLICAAKQEDEQLTQVMLEKYDFQDLDRHLDISGRTVLHLAAMNNWPKILEQTLESASGLKIINSIDHSGSSALHHAAALGHTRCVQVLLNHGASVRLQDRNGSTAAHSAADSGFKDTLVVLLDAKDLDPCQWDHQGRNLAHWAASIDCVDVMQTILTRWPHVDLARKDNLFQLPIDIARVCQCAQVGRLLAVEMEHRGWSTWTLKTYHWDSMYDTPLLEVVPDEDQVALYWDTRAGFEVGEQEHRQRVWEDLHKQYPEEDWAIVLVRDEYYLLWEHRVARKELRALYTQVDASFRSEYLDIRHDLDVVSKGLGLRRGDLKSRIERILPTGLREDIQIELQIIRTQLGIIRSKLDLLAIGLDTDPALDEMFGRLEEMYAELAGVYASVSVHVDKIGAVRTTLDAAFQLEEIRTKLDRMRLKGLIDSTRALV
ncbi:hypothetical protein BDV59DRAFT_11113 [Aspergillus ambiguus]|uniref:ankyrin repeat domain-containing protein n=1 Tax=Aspergillus ambiguus TaxID=176160 RepID=UPI003CCCB3CB